MNKILYSIIFIIGLSVGLNAQLYNVSFDTDTDAGKLNVVMKLSFDAASGLADSNIQFDYDPAVLANPTLISTPLSDAAYNYNQLNVTEPAVGRVSFNILFTSDPFPVPANNDVEIALVQLDIINPGAVATDLVWNTTFTEIFDENFDFYSPGVVNNGLNTSLPIEIKTFEANKLGERSAKLDWTTAIEIDFSHFEVERSTDGINWTKIGRVHGKALNGNGASYTYIDENIALPRANKSTFFYRLNMVDYSGYYEYSDIKSVSFDNDGVAVEVYPNPTSDFISIDSDSQINHVTLFDVDGKLILDQNYNDSTLDISQLKSGLYRLVITTDSGEYNKSIIKID